MSLPATALAAMIFAAAPVDAAPRPVERDEILEAMRRSVGYDLKATTNGARLQAEVILSLARAAASRDPERRPFLLGHGEWFSAYLERTGLTAEKVPLYVRLAYEHGQDVVVDYRAEEVLEATGREHPDLTANVVISWPPSGPRRYSYEDALATPRLKVTNERVIRYRLVSLGDLVLYDEIEGLRGRPTTGLLGLLFDLIGEGHVVESRMIVTPDGLQIARARARKAFFEVASTVTVHPDGRTEKGLPPDRRDLLALESRLKTPLGLRYRKRPSS